MVDRWRVMMPDRIGRIRGGCRFLRRVNRPGRMPARGKAGSSSSSTDMHLPQVQVCPFDQHCKRRARHRHLPVPMCQTRSHYLSLAVDRREKGNRQSEASHRYRPRQMTVRSFVSLRLPTTAVAAQMLPLLDTALLLEGRAAYRISPDRMIYANPSDLLHPLALTPRLPSSKRRLCPSPSLAEARAVDRAWANCPVWQSRPFHLPPAGWYPHGMLWLLRLVHRRQAWTDRGGTVPCWVGHLKSSIWKALGAVPISLDRPRVRDQDRRRVRREAVRCVGDHFRRRRALRLPPQHPADLRPQSAWGAWV